MSRCATIAAVVAAVTTAGCAILPTRHAPQYAAADELVLSYQGGYELWAGNSVVAKGYRYDGLSDFVRCVPLARRHAEQAEAVGSIAVPLQILGVTATVGGIGGLTGLAYIGHDNRAAAALLGGGAGLQLIGLLLVAAGAQAKVSANGHAVDAMNYYNDALGSRGGSCRDRPGKRYW